MKSVLPYVFSGDGTKVIRPGGKGLYLLPVLPFLKAKHKGCCAKTTQPAKCSASSGALAENLLLVASGSSCGSIHDQALPVPKLGFGGYPHS